MKSILYFLLLSGGLSALGSAGDRTAAPDPGRLTVKKVIVCEYRTWYIASDGNVYGYNNASPTVVKFPIGGRKAVDGSGAFNEFRVLDDQGYIWKSKIDYTTNTLRYDTDTTGAPFNGNIAVFACQNTTLTIRSDGSVWCFGNDDYHLFTSTGTVGMRAIQLSPAGMVVKKLAMGGYRIVALTASGDVYEWTYGNGTRPVKKTIPAPATDIFASHFDYAGCIIPATAGSTMGYPYVWGTAWGSWGSSTSATYTQPAPVRALWKVRAPIKEISVNWNTTHYIDSLGNLYGFGFNAQGEVGNGQEFVNKYTYSTFPGFGWSFVDGQNPTGAPAIRIGKGVKWSKLFSNNWFSFYKYAMDVNGNLYSWGRNKALVLGNGLANLQETDHPNALDVLAPTLVTPLKAIFQTYNFTPPVISAGANQTTDHSMVTLCGSATAPLLIKSTNYAANGIDTINYTIVSYQWTKIKGVGGKITNPGSATTTVTGLVPGIYIFNLKAKDNKKGMQSANVTITVTNSDQTQKE
jgi:hypothetical protein